jgi:hypothetical protein
MVILELKIDNSYYAIYNIYNHCQDKEKDQITFLENLENKFQKYSKHIIIAAGDYNIIQNPSLDKWNAKSSDKPSKAAEKLKELLSSNNLLDIWRLQNPNMKKYTWSRRTTKGIQQSRLDYFIINEILAIHTTKAEIQPGFNSDHSLVSIEINNHNNSQKGKGYWKFNNSLLEDADYLKFIKPKIEEYTKEDTLEVDDKLFWDALKMKIRRDTITYSIHRSKKLKVERVKLKEELEKAEDELNNSDGSKPTIIEHYWNCKNEWQKLENSRTAGYILRSKAQWVEEGERNSKFFIGLEKHRQEVKNITELDLGEDKTITDDKEILNALNSFYKKLYNNDMVDKNLFEEYTSDCTLEESDKASLEGNIALEECKEALLEMPNNKSPGLDGFTIEFYKKFWNILGPIYLNCITEIFKSGEMSHDQKNGIISLIPKGDKNPRYIKNWRPISLLNVDYKILTKVLANRIKKVLPTIIHQDQTAYVKDRQIGQNIRVVQDLIDFCKTFNIDGALLLIDFEKAFDSISWDFLQHALKEFGFGEGFRRWVKIIYSNISSHVQNNGHISERFDLGRGIRQGCPVSPYLFIVCVELLASKIRANEEIEGLKIGQVEHKVLQFADDTVLLLKNKKSIIKSLEMLKIFGKSSGLKMNIDKTELFRLGESLPFNVNDLKLKWVSEFRYLGIQFCDNKLDMEFKNFRHRLDNMRNLLRIWKQRDLSLKGKVVIIKSLAMAQLIYPMSMLFSPKWVVKEAEKYFYDFLWDGKPDKVSRTTVIRAIEDGGLKMVDIDAMARALKCKWVHKLCDSENWDKKWASIPRFFFFHISMEEFCASHYTEEMLPTLLPDFYRQCLISLSEIKCDNLNTLGDIKDQYIWYNKYITQKGKPLMFDDWYQKGIVKINDLLDINNNFVSLEYLVENYDIKNSQYLQYNIIKCCIPNAWKRSLRNNKDSHEEDRDYDWHIDVSINGANHSLESCPTRLLYKGFVEIQTKKELKCVKYWQGLLGIDKESLYTYFCIPFQNIRDVKIQSLQFKILHNIFPNNLRKFQWRVSPSNTCDYCDKVDDIIHHFCNCDNSNLFWHGLIEWFNRLNNTNYILNQQDILLGYVGKGDHLKQLNFILLFAKWYIYRTKYLTENLFLLEFLIELKSRLRAEKLIYIKKNELYKFEVEWSWILDEL